MGRKARKKQHNLLTHKTFRTKERSKGRPGLPLAEKRKKIAIGVFSDDYMLLIITTSQRVQFMICFMIFPKVIYFVR